MASMLGEVLRAGRLQHIDYLYQLTRITHRGRHAQAVRPAELPVQRAHPRAAVADLLGRTSSCSPGTTGRSGCSWWRSPRLHGGRAGAALPRTLPPLLRAGLVVACSTLVFSLHGLWNFTRAMSGTAWLTANLLVVVALVLAVAGPVVAGLGARVAGEPHVRHGVRRLAGAGGARLCPAGAVVAPALPLVVGGVIMLVWLAIRPAPPQAATPSSDPGSLVYYFLAIVGKLWTVADGGIAAAAGAGILACYAVLAGARTAREPRLWFWWALAGHAFLGAVLVAVSPRRLRRGGRPAHRPLHVGRRADGGAGDRSAGGRGAPPGGAVDAPDRRPRGRGRGARLRARRALRP